jgi:hypothetical protein
LVAAAEEGFRGRHQRSEGTSPTKARAAGAHPRWPVSVRGGAGPSGWRSPAVRGFSEPSAASGGRGLCGEGRRREGGCWWRGQSGRETGHRGGDGRRPFKGVRWGGSGGGGPTVRVPRSVGGRTRTGDVVRTRAHRPLMRGPRLVAGGRGEERYGARGPAREKKIDVGRARMNRKVFYLFK